MNAHTPSRELLQTAEIKRCPAARIARRLTLVYGAIDDLDQRQGPYESVDQHEANELERELWDRIEALQQELEWVRPETLSGVYAQLMRLRDLARTMSEEAGDLNRSKTMRRFDRLNALALEGFERLGGFDTTALGASSQHIPIPSFVEVMCIASTADEG